MQRLTGTRRDNSSEFSEFAVKADSTGAKFTWTSNTNVGCVTCILSNYQPKIVEFEKRDDNGETVSGAKLQLYYGDEEYGEPWITTND